MQLHSGTLIDDGELPVHMNPGHGRPFGVIHLSDETELTFGSDEDCDRIIRAAARIKAMRTKLGTPHEYKPGAGKYGTHCDVCGDLDDKDHWRPEPKPLNISDETIEHVRYVTQNVCKDLACPENYPHDPHEQDADAKCLNENRTVTGVDYCTRLPGHDGAHNGHNGATWRDEPWADVPEPQTAPGDPFGPDAYKTHGPGCACWDCRDAREQDAAPAQAEAGAA